MLEHMVVALVVILFSVFASLLLPFRPEASKWQNALLAAIIGYVLVLLFTIDYTLVGIKSQLGKTDLVLYEVADQLA